MSDPFFSFLSRIARVGECLRPTGPEGRKNRNGREGAIESISAPLVDGYADSDKPVAESPLPGDQLLDDEADSEDGVDPLVPAAEFADYIKQFDAAGFQVKVHAIGDGTVRATLDGYEATIRENGNNRLRHHIDHCNLIHLVYYINTQHIDRCSLF